MPAVLTTSDIPLTAKEVEALWQATRALRHFPDETVTVQAVSEAEIATLNQTYRKKMGPTNVLTFSYGMENQPPADVAEHDIALCLSIARTEAQTRHAPEREYIALLLVHAFLHVTGLDHERADTEATATHQAEKTILTQTGFTSLSL